MAVPMYIFGQKNTLREWKSDEIFELQTEVVEGIATNMNADIAKDELEILKKYPTKSKAGIFLFSSR